jgi:hypothetical protein
MIAVMLGDSNDMKTQDSAKGTYSLRISFVVRGGRATDVASTGAVRTGNSRGMLPWQLPPGQGDRFKALPGSI